MVIPVWLRNPCSFRDAIASVALGLAMGCAHQPVSEISGVGPISSVGTVTLEIEDSTRRDPVDATRSRQWMAQLYYPTSPAPVPDMYAGDPALLDALVAEDYYGASEAQLRSWARRPAPAIEGAAPATRAPLPMVTLSPGLGFARLNYAELAAALVGRGYVVAVIDHPYIGISRFPDGRVTRAEQDPALTTENPADSLPRVHEWARDVSVVLDRLAAKPVPGLAIDFTRVTATGHSIGGTAAVEVCGEDPRVSACIDFEGFLEGTHPLERGAAGPTLAVWSRAKGRPPVAPAGQGDGDERTLAALVARGEPCWIVKVTGGSHTSFSDAPDVLPETLSRFGGELMTPARSMDLYTGLVDAFARAYGPGGGKAGAFQSFLDGAPETSGRHAP